MVRNFVCETKDWGSVPSLTPNYAPVMELVDVAGLDPVALVRVGSSPTGGTKRSRKASSLLDPDLIMGDDVSLSERLRCRIANPVRLVQFQQDTPNSACVV